jgi:CDP-paratose 2-epimerase
VNRVLITGAAGFIGTNLALALKEHFDLLLIDDFSRLGSRSNAQLLKKSGLDVLDLDVSEYEFLISFIGEKQKLAGLINLAAQTSLLESYKNPKLDFTSNALGTLNLLEYLRLYQPKCKGIFLSSNKVYGNLRQLDLVELPRRFQLVNLSNGFDEQTNLDPIGGYSISKYVTDSYVREYGQRYAMPVVSLRQSAVYGPYQNPRTDQGWVSFFTESYVRKEEVTLRGKGKQVRDILHVNDFCQLILRLLEIDLPNGESFNTGGGIESSLSILELFDLLNSFGDHSMQYKTGIMSNDDQPYFVSDNSKILQISGWKPEISPEVGISMLYDHLNSVRN